MCLLFEVVGQGMILGIVPESFEVLIFGIALVLLAVSLRWLMKRGEANVRHEIEKTK